MIKPQGNEGGIAVEFSIVKSKYILNIDLILYTYIIKSMKLISYRKIKFIDVMR